MKHIGKFQGAFKWKIMLCISFCISEIFVWKTYSFDFFDIILIMLIYLCETILISQKPINALLALISCFFISMNLTFYYCEFAFLPLIILLLYIGAIAVLFLFITMLFRHPETGIELYTFTEKVVWICLQLTTWVLTYISISQIFEFTKEHQNLMLEFNYALDINIIANHLYSSESSLFIILSILLLAVLIATGLLTRSCSTLSNVLPLLVIIPNDLKETLITFGNCWPIEQWMYSLLGLVLLYFMLFILYNYMATYLNKIYKYKLYVLSLNLRICLLLMDIIINIIVDILILYICPITFLSKLILKCPISLSPFILLGELIIMCIYSYIKNNNFKKKN